MAGDWLKMEAATPDKPEVLAITAAMGWDDPDLTVGKLFRLWRWFDQQTTDGNAVGVTPALLDRICGVTGFAQAMANVGWLVITDTGVALPNFDRHHGETAKQRALSAKRVAKSKSNAKNNADSNDEGNAACVTNALPREEKRRKEIITNPNGLVVASDAGRPICPHKEIITLYHEILPCCPRVRDWTAARAAQLRARWNEEVKRQDLDWWRGFFTYVGESNFLMGRTVGPGKNPFIADLEWITKSSNFTKIREGKYENKVAA